MKSVIGYLLCVVGWVLCALAVVSGIGYCLYEFAHGVAIALALWNGFALFLKMIGSGFVALIVGLVLVHF